MKTLWIPFVLCLVPASAWAQSQTITTFPPNLVVPNYDSVPVGPFGGLESTAYIARVGDPSAAWFNPAGLAREIKAQISGSAGVYSRTAVAPQTLSNQGGSVQQLPNFVGFTFKLREGMTGGFALLANNAWNQQTDAELITPVATGQERFAYSADSKFTRRVAAVSVGYHHKGGWRYGGGFGFSLTNLRLVQSASDRIGDATGLETVLVTSRVSGTAFQLRGQGGVQYDTGEWRFGGAVRTPGVNLYRDGTISLDGVLSPITGSLGASLFDTDASFECHIPWEFQAGVGLVRERYALELDLQAYTGIAAYPLMASGQPFVVYVDTGAGTPPAVISQPFGGLISESDSVFNVGVGGSFKVMKSRNLKIHGGVASNGSPVGPADEVFTRVGLLSWTIGASGSLGKFEFSVGFNRQTGTSDEITVRNLLNGQVARTRADVRINGVVYHLAYQF